MLKAITNNPYRFLGVLSNSTTRERVSNQNKLKAYLKVGKTVEFPMDMCNVLRNIDRTLDGIETAINKINLPKDQLKYSLFWFIGGNSIDKMAIEYIQHGNIEKANELFDKKETFSSLINKGVLSFINNDIGTAIGYITKLIHDDELRCQFTEVICGNTFSISEEELAHLFIDALLEEFSVSEIKDLFEENGTSFEDDEYLTDKYMGEPIKIINEAISEAKDVDSNDSQAQYNAGTKLIRITKKPLRELKEILGESDSQYQIIADSLAKQILQCGINYYNKSNEDEYEEIDKALTIQKYAFQIAVGKLTKDRCRENVSILENKKDELPPKEVSYYDKLIKLNLLKFSAKPDVISASEELIKDTVIYLMSIKEELGSSHSYYLKISTVIVNAALHNIIEEFNSVMNESLKIELILNRESAMRKIKNLFEKAWKATLYLDKLDMENDFRINRYNPNRESLKKQVEQIININQRVVLNMKSESQIFNACKTVADYEKYKKQFPGGKYASIVESKIENIEFNSCKTTQDCKKFKEKYPNSSLPINTKWEDCYYSQCNTIEFLNGYLKAYPSGRYRLQAEERIDKLEYEKCNTAQELRNYTIKYPNGRFRHSAELRIDKYNFEACTTIDDYKRYIRNYPNGQFCSNAERIIADEEFWKKCISSDSKAIYKEYLAKFPHGRHKAEAENKASACYIATMVYGDYNHPQVVILRHFRDEILQDSKCGRTFIKYYYKYSPKLVEMMSNKKHINNAIRFILDKLIKLYRNENN